MFEREGLFEWEGLFEREGLFGSEGLFEREGLLERERDLLSSSNDARRMLGYTIWRLFSTIFIQYDKLPSSEDIRQILSSFLTFFELIL